MSTNTTDWTNITADATHVIVDYSDGNSFNTLINAYLATDTIWVAKGTYTIDLAIALKADQKMYGGFDGTEISPSARAKSDLDGNGDVEPWEFTNATEITSPVSTNALTFGINSIADGLTFKNITITNNATNANIIAIFSSATGSVLRNSIVKDCSVTSTVAVNTVTASNGIVQNCLMQNNSLNNTTGAGTSNGAGLYLTGALSRGIGCVIRGNKTLNLTTSKSKGGGVFMQSGAKLINCVVYNNENQGQGGGVYVNDATTEVINCTVAKNKSGLTGGGIYMNGGGICNNSIAWSNMENSSSTAIPNDVYYGGTSAAKTTFQNDYLAYGLNEKSLTVTALPDLANCKLITSGEFADNTLDGITDFAPKFKNPTTTIGAPADISSIQQANYKLLTGSPCIDFASNALLNTLTITTDLMTGTRFVNTKSDLGAYEFGSVPTTAVKNIKNSNYKVFKNGQGLVVTGLSGENTISVFGLNGVLLQNISTIESEISLPITQKGVYVLKIKTVSTSETLKAIF